MEVNVLITSNVQPSLFLITIQKIEINLQLRLTLLLNVNMTFIAISVNKKNVFIVIQNMREVSDISYLSMCK